MTDVPSSETDVEELSRLLHAIYQDEARRQAGTGDDEVRHPDEYDEMPEHTKEYDRVLARFILKREERMRQEPQWLLTGNLDWLEVAMADYIAKWGANWVGRPYDGNTAGMPCAVANMAMTVIRKNIQRIEAPGGREMTEAETTRISVAEIEAGDRFLWCDRAVTVHHWDLARTKRPARWIHCIEANGNTHRLHYYDDEYVTAVSPTPDQPSDVPIGTERSPQ